MSHGSSYHLGVTGMHEVSPSFHLGNYQLPQSSFSIPALPNLAPVSTFAPMSDLTNNNYSLLPNTNFSIARPSELMSNVHITTGVTTPHFQQPDLVAGAKTAMEEMVLHLSQSRILGQISLGLDVVGRLKECGEHINRDLIHGKGPLEALICNATETGFDGVFSALGTATVSATIPPLTALSLANPAIGPVAYDITVNNYATSTALSHNMGQSAGQTCHNGFDWANNLAQSAEQAGHNFFELAKQLIVEEK